MPRAATAPRRKTKPATEQRGAKLSAVPGVCNAGKLADVMKLDARVAAFKNRLSRFCHDRLGELVAQPYAFKSRYKEHRLHDLNAWETQALFHDIVGDYQRAIAQRLQGNAFFVQRGWTFDRYRRDVWAQNEQGERVLAHAKGDGKAGTFALLPQRTALSQAATYLLHVARLDTFTVATVKNDEPRAYLTALAAQPEKWTRLLALIRARQRRLLGLVKRITYVTGTHRRHPKESRSGVVFDPSNSEYAYWLKVRVGTGKAATLVHLPLLYNPDRRLPEHFDLAAEFRLKVARGKVHYCGAFEAPALEFAPVGAVLGLDANTKRNLLTDSHGRAYDYDRLWLDGLVAQLEKLCAKGLDRLTHREKARLARLTRANEWRIKQLLSSFLAQWAEEGITDLVLEDLALAKDATFLQHEEFNVKFSRLSRLLRLSNLKKWLTGQAEKRGVRVHTTHAAYSSQECPHCHCVDRDNRPSQAEFKCVGCGFDADADAVAAYNLENRLTSSVLGERLHVFDAHDRATPASLTRAELKELLRAPPDPGVFTVPLPPGTPTKVHTPDSRPVRYALKEAPPQPSTAWA